MAMLISCSQLLGEGTTSLLGASFGDSPKSGHAWLMLCNGNNKIIFDCLHRNILWGIKPSTGLTAHTNPIGKYC